MIKRLLCRLLRHDHSMVQIMCIPTDGGKPLVSHPMDRWSAEYVMHNIIAPEGKFAGRRVERCRIVVP